MTDVIERIQNASRKAQEKYLRFLKRKRTEQRGSYKEIGDSVRGEILAASDDEGRIPMRRLPILDTSVAWNMDALGSWEDNWILEALDDSAELGTGGMLAIAGIVGISLPHAKVAGIPGQAAEFAKTFVAKDGLTLSPRLWKIHEFQKYRVNEALRQIVVEGESVRKTAQELLGRGKPLGKSVQQAFSRTTSLKIGGEIHNLFTPKGRKNLLFNTERMLITETNRARGRAYIDTCDVTPGVIGMRVVLSPSHPRADICDEITSRDDYGLGPGGYPLDQLPLYPFHPLCLCILVPIFRGDIS